MPRAFLSHSSEDKAYVRDVANRLGRARVVLDEQAFLPAEDFRDEIRRTLDDSTVFVFFVSDQSLASTWCRFELDEAELRSIRGTLRRSFALFIDQHVDSQLLPSWLRRVRAIHAPSPAHAARIIHGRLSTAPGEAHPFIGRHDDLQRGQRILANQNPPPRVLVATGLEGIGRKAYLRKLVQDSLSLDLAPIIALPTMATIEDLYVATLDSAALIDKAEAESAIDAFRALSRREQASEVAGQLTLIARQGTAPCIVDNMAMLDSSGRYFDDFANVLCDFAEDEEPLYLCLAHTRSPVYRDLRIRGLVFERRLKPLPDPDSQVLLTRLLREESVVVSQDKVSTLSDAIRGYPPTAYFIASEVEGYGADVVLGQPTRLADFESRSFSRFVRNLRLEQNDRVLLRYLTSEEHLPLDGIATATGITTERCSEIVSYLIDLNVIERIEDEYAVTAPIRRTVGRLEGGLGRRWYESAFRRLEAEYWSDDNSLPPLSIVDATLRASLRIGTHASQASRLVRPSLLIRAAQEMYFRQEYNEALAYADRARTMGALTAQLIEIIIRSHTQLHQYGEARAALFEYRQFAERRQWYLDGFIDRKAGRHAVACRKFQEGYSRGDRSISLLRDYADSLLRTEAVEPALEIATEARDKEPSSIYVLDLLARIEIAHGSLEDAQQALEDLEVADVDEQFILTRRASFLLYRKGTAEAVRTAVQLAERACARRDAPISAFALLAKALLRARSWERYGEVREIILKKRGTGAGQRLLLSRLDSQAAIARGDWRRAERALNDDDRSVAARILRAKILATKGDDGYVPLPERRSAKADAKSLQDELGIAERLTLDEYDLYE